MTTTLDLTAVITAALAAWVAWTIRQERRRRIMAVHFGTRFFVLLILRAIAEYARHKVKIDQDLSPGLRTCITELLTFSDELTGLNIPGPE